MKTNNLTETFYHNTNFYHSTDTGLCVYAYHVLDCPKEYVNLVCNMLSNLARLYELEVIHEFQNCSGSMEDEFYGCNIFEEERCAAVFDLTTLCYAENIVIYSVCLELKDLADLTDGYHKTIPEFTYNKREF